MFHVELRQFPHNVNRFNVGDAELRAIVEPWVREQWIELGERKWNPHEARMTILEGPELAVQQISLGRGWPTAQRQGQDVTERVLAAARQGLQPRAGPGSGGGPSAAPGDVGDPLAMGVQLAALLGPDPSRLLEAWRSVAAGAPQLSPSEALAAAERALAADREGPR
jgi:hypothetical protein